MTKKEAKEILQEQIDKYGQEYDAEGIEALEIAIKVLEQEPKFIAKSDGAIEQIKNCEDCIFKKEWGKIGKLISVILEKQTEQEPKTDRDCISRKAVLGINESHHGQMPNHINHQIWQEINDLPSVNMQVPKTGHWIDGEIESDDYKLPIQICSECNTFYPLSYTGGGHKYCPNCGAKMESEG